MVLRCYPQGKRKAFNITYDDGIEQDVRFVALLNRYGLKGTFNLNYRWMQEEFAWIHPNGMTVRRLGFDAVRHLYDGHEIASHTLTHPDLRDLSDAELQWEIGEDKRQLEAFFGREVAGFAVPFHYYDERIAECVRNCGFVYGRMSEESRNYSVRQNPYYWCCGIFHLAPELDAYVDGFFETKDELALCQIVGHSYDLDAENMWERMEAILRRIAEDPDVATMTHLELVRYLQAMEQVVMDEGIIRNPSEMELWFRIGDEICCVKPGETRKL